MLIFCCLAPRSNPVPGGCGDACGLLLLGALLRPLCPGVTDSARLGPGGTAPGSCRGRGGCCANVTLWAQGWHLQLVQWLLAFGCERATLHRDVLLEWLRAAPPGMRCSQPAQPLNLLFRRGCAGQSRQERDISSTLSLPDDIKYLS